MAALTKSFGSGDLKVDLEKRQVFLRGEPVKPSPKECDLLKLPVQHAGKALARLAVK